jgi:hypothetical protein
MLVVARRTEEAASNGRRAHRAPAIDDARNDSQAPIVDKKKKRGEAAKRMNELARRVLADARRSARVTPRQLATKLGRQHEPSYIREIENGTRRLTRAAFVRMARALHGQRGPAKLFKQWLKQYKSDDDGAGPEK